MGGVVVLDGVTVTQDVALTADPSTVSVAISVVDGSGGGWPLYATVTVAGPGGTTAGLTDPITGVRSVDLFPCDTYTVDVAAVSPGYKPATVTHSPLTSGTSLSVGLAVDKMACTAPGYTFVGLEESFDVAGRLPAGWSVANIGGCGGYSAPSEWGYGGGYSGAIWRADDPGYRGNLTGGSGGFVSADIQYFYDYYGSYGTGTDTTLVSASVDLTGIDEVWLQFDSDYYGGGTGQAATILVDEKGTLGAPYGYRVYGPRYSSARTTHHAIDISARAANQSFVRIQFRFQGVSGKWWQLDNVRFGGCARSADGLVTGHVRRASTSAPMIGATVSDTHGNISTTMADGGLGIGDGYFAVGSKAGTQSITGTSHGFGNDVRSIAVTAGAVVSADFAVPDDQALVAPFRSGRTDTARIVGPAGTALATAAATANATSGQLVVDTTASSTLPFGIQIPFTTWGLGSAQGHANARMIEHVEVRPGTRTITASFSFPEQRVEAFAREGYLSPIRGARSALWVAMSLQSLDCSSGTCVPAGPAVSAQANLACLPIPCGGGATDVSASIDVTGYGIVEVQLVVLGMSAVEGNGEASARASGNLLALDVV